MDLRLRLTSLTLVVSMISIALLIVSCKKEKETVYEGIVEVDDEGNILSDDESDWQPRCPPDATVIEGNFCFTHARPNPAVLSTKFSVAKDGSILFFSVYVHKSESEIVKTITENLQVWDWRRDFSWDLKDDEGNWVPDGIYRIKIYTEDIYGNTSESYGDVQVNTR